MGPHRRYSAFFLLFSAMPAMPACLESTQSNCADTGGLDLRVSGDGLPDYNNKKVHARLMDDSRSNWVAQSQQGLVEDGRFDLVMSCGMDRETPYTLHLYIDADDDLACEAPQREPGWIFSISPSQTDQVLDVGTQGSTSDDICDPF